jgi:hypothetical protein
LCKKRRSIREKRRKKAKNCFAKTKKEHFEKVRIFSGEKRLTAATEVNRPNSECITDLPVSDVDENVEVRPFLKSPAKVKVIGVATSNEKKFCHRFCFTWRTANAHPIRYFSPDCVVLGLCYTS